MNPSGDSLRQRASTSPALFNRCVLNWFGDWSNKTLYQVGMELTSNMDITRAGYIPPASMEHVCESLPKQVQYHHAVINSLVHVVGAVGGGGGWACWLICA
jgi:dynein heavy chain 1